MVTRVVQWCFGSEPHGIPAQVRRKLVARSVPLPAGRRPPAEAERLLGWRPGWPLVVSVGQGVLILEPWFLGIRRGLVFLDFGP